MKQCRCSLFTSWCFFAHFCPHNISSPQLHLCVKSLSRSFSVVFVRLMYRDFRRHPSSFVGRSRRQRSFRKRGRSWLRQRGSWGRGAARHKSQRGRRSSGVMRYTEYLLNLNFFRVMLMLLYLFTYLMSKENLKDSSQENKHFLLVYLIVRGNSNITYTDSSFI